MVERTQSLEELVLQVRRELMAVRSPKQAKQAMMETEAKVERPVDPMVFFRLFGNQF